MQINGELCNHLPWPTVSLEKKCLSLIFHLSVYSQTKKNLPSSLPFKSRIPIFFKYILNPCVLWHAGKEKKKNLPWKPLENDSGWKEEEIDLFCTLFFIIVITVLLKERLLIAEMFFQFCDQSHQRKKLRFPNKAHEQDRCNSQRPRYC